MEEKQKQQIKTFIKKEICEPLYDLVKWDRYYIGSDGSGVIYGWIEREDKKWDFIVCDFWLYLKNGEIMVDHSFVTSSQKWSKEIHKTYKFPEEEHNDCRSAIEIGDIELADWQKETKRSSSTDLSSVVSASP